MLTDTQRAALTPFVGLLDTMTDDALAAAAEVPVEVAAAFRAESVAPAVDPAPTEKPRRAKKAEVAAPAEVVAASVAEIEPAEVEVPRLVEVVVSRIIDPTWGALRREPRLGDFYHGPDAAYLWTHHRDSVAPAE